MSEFNGKKTVGHVNLWEEKELESYLLGTDFRSTLFQMLHPTRGSRSCAGTQRKVTKQATLHLDKEHTAVGRPSEVSLPNFKLQKPKACGGGVVWWLMGKKSSGDWQWRSKEEGSFQCSPTYIQKLKHQTLISADKFPGKTELKSFIKLYPSVIYLIQK